MMQSAPMPSIGIDLVEVERFKAWHLYTRQQLRRVFSVQEIEHCCAIRAKSAERFAVRFAAKEALFKALARYGRGNTSLLAILPNAEVVVGPSGAELYVEWDGLTAFYNLPTSPMAIQFSLSHTNTTACAVVFLYNFAAPTD